MPDKVVYNRELGVIEVDSYGVVTRDDISGSIEKIQQIQREQGVNRLLVDTTRQDQIPNSIDILEIFSNYPDDIQTVLLVEGEQATEEDVYLVETVAVNRGKNIKIYRDREKALEWLLSLK